MDDCGIGHGIAGRNQQFVVSTETAVAAEPGEGTLNQPAAWQELKPFDGRVTFDDFQVNAGPGEQVSHKVHAAIDAIRPSFFETRKTSGQQRYQPARHWTVGVIRFSHPDFENQAKRIHNAMPFASIYLLVRIEATNAPFLRVLTD